MVSRRKQRDENVVAYAVRLIGGPTKTASPLRSFKHGYPRLDPQRTRESPQARPSSIARFRDPN